MNDSVVRLIKGVAAVAVLLVLILLVGRYWSDFRSADTKKTPTPTETTPTAAPEGESKDTKKADATKSDTKDAGTAKKAVILQVTIDGLNFRKEPSSDGAAIRGLDSGEKVTLIKKQDSWYQVKDSKGVTGWISANKQYTKEVK